MRAVAVAGTRRAVGGRPLQRGWCVPALIAWMSAVSPSGALLADSEQAAETPPRAATPRLELTPLATGVSERLQAVSAVTKDVVWATGLGGRWLRTENGGEDFSTGVIEAELQVRDIDAFDAQTAWALTSGPGGASRIYRTEDGGLTWELQHTNPEPDGFYDCLAAWSDQVAYVYGDSVGGELRILRTANAGESWTRLKAPAIPAALAGEGGFAASGTCAVAQAAGHGWIVTGAAKTARVLKTTDWGESWSAHETPAVAGDASGLTSLTAVGEDVIAVGGRIGEKRTQERRVVRSRDGGATWTLQPEPEFPGPIYGAHRAGEALLLVGPEGVVEVDLGSHAVRLLSVDAYWSVAARAGRAWFVGPDGRMAWLDLALAELTRKLAAPLATPPPAPAPLEGDGLDDSSAEDAQSGLAESG